MKKTLISVVIASTVLFSAASALAADGTVNFTGEIIDTACTVDIGVGNSMTVDLGRVSKTAFTGPGSKASATKFVLKLKECPSAVKSATVKFDGVGYSGDDSVLALTAGAGVAEGVGIELSDSTQVKLPLFTASNSVSLNEGENSIPFYARYIQMAELVSPGPANSVAQFTLNYN